MTNETAVIISALITTSGALIGVIITMIITHRREIKSAKSKFFYNLLPRRFQLYEDVCLWIHNNSVPVSENHNTNINQMLHSLLSFIVRSNMYGTQELTEILEEFKDFIVQKRGCDMQNEATWTEFIMTCGKYYNKIFDYLFSISFPPFIDDNIKIYMKENQKLKKKNK